MFDTVQRIKEEYAAGPPPLYPLTGDRVIFKDQFNGRKSNGVVVSAKEVARRIVGVIDCWDVKLKDGSVVGVTQKEIIGVIRQ